MKTPRERLLLADLKKLGYAQKNTKVKFVESWINENNGRTATIVGTTVSFHSKNNVFLGCLDYEEIAQLAR